MKRLLDIVAAGAGLCLLFPVLIILALLVLATEGRPVFYREYRVGHNGNLFPLYKFRTLRAGSEDGSSVAPEDDPRITGAGLWLRRWRLDEFPQLLAVLLGHMSLVGPRPMPPAHTGHIPPRQLDVVLSVRPGITDPAAIHFLAEDAVLAGQTDAETLYLERFLPAKTRMQINYLEHRSLTEDLKILMLTLRLLWSRSAREQSARAMKRLLDQDPGVAGGLDINLRSSGSNAN